MRLLTRDENDKIILQTFDSDDLPAYAILSHTWHIDSSQEVDFEEAQAGKGQAKDGYKKIRFCAEQATRDGLRYFWIDTCCIKKSSDAELSESINSMFRWYQQATRCYVYLSDVSMEPHSDAQGVYDSSAWEDAVRQSRWFTRGWTLQELLAPAAVEFYSSDGHKLGTKSSLESLICEVTGIAKDALRGSRLADFTTDEKLLWAVNRSTKREEDAIYSLLGMFGVFMPLVYGEGKENALRRLHKEICERSAATRSSEYAVDLNLARIPKPAKFIARELELTDMHRLLYDHDDRSIAVLHGLGGIGKTQLAVAYIHQHKKQYTAIFWIDASSDDSILLSFSNIARQILHQHPSAAVLASADMEDSPARIVEAVTSWLSFSKNTRWLLVYDNYDTPKIPGHTDVNTVDLSQYIPQCDHGSILVTTRSSQVDLGSRIHIKKLTKIEEGLAILSNTSGREGLEEDLEAIALIEELDGLPLALSTAGAYLEQVTTSFSEYRRIYKASWLELQKLSPQVTSYENRSLYTTWQLSLDQISREDECAAKLIKLWAYFDRQDVWYELLQSGQPCQWLQRVTRDRPTFDHTMRLLCSYGLVELGSNKGKAAESTGYNVHSCVHAWIIHVVSQEVDKEMARLALSCVASMVPDEDVDNWWVTQRRLLPHAARCSSFLIDLNLDITEIEWTLHGLGDLYSNQGKLKEAETMYLRALQGKEKTFGPKHRSTLDTVHNLGSLYKDQGKLKEAEAMYLRDLEGCEEALGLKHPSTLTTVNNLGMLYADQGKLKEAETMYLRALQGLEEVLGLKHRSTLDTVNNLGNLYKDQGKLKEAEAMYLRDLEGCEEALGLKHPSTLATLNNLGSLYKYQGKLKEAEGIYLQVLQGKEEALGPTHMSTLNTVNNLGNLYKDQGKLKEAEDMHLRALEGKEEALGLKHPSTLTTVNNLGSLYVRQGKLKEAEAMYLRAMLGYNEALGADHVQTYTPALDTLYNMGGLYAKLNQNEKAIEMYSNARSGFGTVRGHSAEICQHIDSHLKALNDSMGEKERQAHVEVEHRSKLSRSRVKAYIKKFVR